MVGWLGTWPLLGVLVGCSASPPVDDIGGVLPEPLELSVAPLPDGDLGFAYRAPLEVQGATGGITWVIEGAPAGLFVSDQGVLRGRPTEYGRFVVSLTAEDDVGATGVARRSLTVAPNETVLGCGEEVTGAFGDAPPHTFLEAFAWEDAGGYRWIELADWPEGTTRVELLPTTPVAAWLQRPGSDPRSEAYWDYVFRASTLDAGTRYPLDAYEGSAIRLLVASNTGDPARPGDWGVRVACTRDDLIFAPVDPPPVPLGTAFDVALALLGGVSDATFELVGTLPNGVSFDATGARITGAATEVGRVFVEVRATTPDGAAGRTRFSLSTYETDTIGCDEERTVSLGPSVGLDLDPAAVGAWRTFETTVDPGVSRVTVTLVGGDDMGLAFVDPGAPDHRLQSVRRVESAFGATDPTSLTLVADAQRWPSLTDLAAPRPLRTAVWNGASSTIEATLSVTCDREPIPDVPVLPVLEPGTPGAWPLGAIGGTPPYAWFAQYLPEGVTLDADGTLRHDGSAVRGTYTPLLIVEDANGSAGSLSRLLHVTETSACPLLPVLACGDVLLDSFTRSIYEVHGACVSASAFRDGGPVTVTVEPGGLTEPWLTMRGLEPDEHAYEGHRRGPRAITIDDASFSSTSDLTDVPLFLGIANDRPGPYRVRVSCP